MLTCLGEHHYHQMNRAYGPGLEGLYSSNDKSKLKLCKENEISLIIVPYWWDSTMIQLKEFITHQKTHLNNSLLNQKILNIE